jgi:branched-chain amino acid transport system permease protein
MMLAAAPWPQLRRILDHRIAGPALKLVGGYVLLFEIGLQLAFGRLRLGPIEVGNYDLTIPRGVFVDGFVFGAMYGLLGMGLILVYRANRIINFAQAQLGAVPAVLALLLISTKGWNYFLVIPILLAGSVVLGAGVDRLVVSRFRSAPRLILTVVTIGVGFVLLVAEFATKQALTDDLVGSATQPIPTPWQDFTFQVGATRFNGDHIFAAVVVAVVAAAVGALLRWTDIGIAIRASAENGERASMLGIPIGRVSTVVWVLATVLSAIGIFLRAPLVGLPLTGFIGPGLLLLGLTTAVIARMESLPRALVAGMLIGGIDRAVLFQTQRPSLAQAAMLGVILIALLLQRGHAGRAHDTGTTTWQAVKEIRPIPAELRTLPEVRRAKLVVAPVVALVALVMPFVVGVNMTGRITQLVIYAIVGVSLVVLTGWSGQISLGQFAISGVGAAAAGGLAANHGWDFFATLAVATVAGAVIAIVIGLPALRIQGLFLAVTTLAAAFTVQGLVLSPDHFGWLLPGDFAFVERPVLWGVWDVDASSEWLGVEITGDAKYYWLCLAFLGVAAVVARSLRQNRSGRVFIGVRDNGRLMQAFGVNLARTRLASFAVSGAIAGLAGALFAYQARTVDAETYTPQRSILLFAVVVIGGMGTVTGAVLGTVVVLGLPLLPGLRDVENIDLLLSGVGLVWIPMVLPGGLAEGVFRLRDTWLRRLASRRGIHVPSLVADSLVTGEDEETVDTIVADVADTPLTVAPA